MSVDRSAYAFRPNEGSALSPVLRQGAESKCGHRVIYGITTEPIGLNPIAQPDIVSRWAMELVFDGLVEVDDSLRLIPCLASSWETAPDALSLAFCLRRGVKWHDGQPCTAADVQFTYDTIRDPSVMPTIPKSDYASIAHIDTPDDHTVVFRLKRPDASLLSKLVTGIAPSHLLQGRDPATSQFNRQPIGTGPFLLESWQRGRQLSFVANPDYFGGRPHLHRIVWKIVSDTPSVTLQLLRGEIDGAAVSEPHAFRRIQHDVNLAVYPVLGGDFQISLQLQNPLFQDRRVRRALAYALDKQAMVDGLMDGAATIATSDILPSSWAYNPQANTYPFNPDRARALLTTSGWEPGLDGILAKDGRPFRFELITDADDELRRELALLVRRQWAAVGVQADVALVERNALIFQRLLKCQFEAALLQTAVRADPDLSLRFHSRSIDTGHNALHYANPRADAVLDQALIAQDQDVRRTLYFRLQRLLAEDLPQIPLFHPRTGYAFRADLKGVSPSSISPFWNVEAWGF
jgi:peptide/nickel transport system substrate-binding protein